ncbi:lysine transporter LysE [Pseudoalteromonas piscicida]|uniref:Lysine transporter LysE n=1 Tax=Pseudoalteromonas piscicida TaxID=43662 RepID=A0A2A5JRX9_PSEO7|nr:lysine transporter LysE [Pseudoalteromonas piscicida]
MVYQVDGAIESFIFISHLLWIKAGDLLARVSNDPNYNKWLNRFYGGCLYLVAAWLIFDNEIWLEGLI